MHFLGTRLSARPHRPRLSRKSIFPAVLLVCCAVAGVWLLNHGRDRSEEFTERRGRIARADSQPAALEASRFISQSIRVATEAGLEVDFRVLRPNTPDAEKVPVVVLLGGHRTGRDAVDLLGDPQGIAVVALDYPYHGPERIRGAGQVLRTLPTIQRALLDTPPAVSIAVDWLVTQPWVDLGRMELMGVSLGVPFAAVAGALDERFRRVWLIHGGVDNRAWLANRLEAKIPNRLLRAPAASLLHLLAYGRTFRTETWTPRIAPRSVVIIGAVDDEQMPPENVRRLHAATGDPKELLWTEGRHIGARRPEIIRQLLTLVRSRVKELPMEASPG